MTQHEELVVPSDSFYALALVGETTASAFRMADEEVYAVKFCVKTSLGAERDAQLVNTRIVDSNGGIRCYVGDLVVDGIDVGLGVIFTDRATEISYCCFCCP